MTFPSRLQGAHCTLSADQKETIIHRTTDLYAEIYGERARANTGGADEVMLYVLSRLDGYHS